jgi:hypothetical protein
MKIHPVGAELFHADRQRDKQTDTMKLTVIFHNFANVSKKDAMVQIHTLWHGTNCISHI